MKSFPALSMRTTIGATGMKWQGVVITVETMVYVDIVQGPLHAEGRMRPWGDRQFKNAPQGLRRSVVTGEQKTADGMSP